MLLAGIAHSYLGERAFLPRLLALPDLPLLRRGERGFTERVIRAVWHIASLYWWLAAAVLAIIAMQPANPLRAIGLSLAATIFLTALVCIYCGCVIPRFRSFSRLPRSLLTRSGNSPEQIILRLHGVANALDDQPAQHDAEKIRREIGKPRIVTDHGGLRDLPA